MPGLAAHLGERKGGKHMNAILGKIQSVDKSAASEPSRHRMEIKFSPRCVMPERTKVPEWLKDQTLTVTRTVMDPREIGGPGDSIVLTPAESRKWLAPLTVTPVICFGSLPSELTVALRWWKDEKPPEIEVTANGRTRRIKLEKSGDQYEAEVSSSEFYGGHEALPTEVVSAAKNCRQPALCFRQTLHRPIG